MEIILELLFQIIIEGSLEITSYKKIPMIIRIFTGTLVLTVYVGLIGFFLYGGIKNSQPVLILIGLFIVLLSFFATKKVIKKRRKM